MKRFIVISHGHFGKESVESLRLIMGDLADNFDTISVTANKSHTEVYEETKSVLDKSNYDDLFVFCDIYGGTPFNVALKLYLEGYPINIYTGFNLPLLLEIAMLNNEEEIIIKNRIEDVGKDLFKYVNDMVEKED